MNEVQIVESYKFCLENGWVHNTPIEDILLDYIERNKLFEAHINKIKEEIKKNKKKQIHILIGEAPPYYPNEKFPTTGNRKYFYNPKHSHNTPYFRKPYEHFLRTEFTKKNKGENDKEKLLNKLAKNGVLIFDIFPFPIFQDTKIRARIDDDLSTSVKDYDSNSDSDSDSDSKKQNLEFINDKPLETHVEDKDSNFNTYLTNYFLPRILDLIQSLVGFKKNIDINLYMFAPKYTSIQFLYWLTSDTEEKSWIFESLIKFHDNGQTSDNKFSNNSFLNNSVYGFIDKLTKNDKLKKDDFINNYLNKIPIFMDGSGNPNFDNFVNGEKKPKKQSDK